MVDILTISKGAIPVTSTNMGENGIFNSIANLSTDYTTGELLEVQQIIRDLDIDFAHISKDVNQPFTSEHAVQMQITQDDTSMNHFQLDYRLDIYEQIEEIIDIKRINKFKKLLSLVLIRISFENFIEEKQNGDA